MNFPAHTPHSFKMPPSAKAPPTLLNCENEPVRSPGCVQPFGVVFVVDALTGCIVQFSSNAMGALALPASVRIFDATPERLLVSLWNASCEGAFQAAKEAAVSAQKSVGSQQDAAPVSVQAKGGGMVHFHVRPCRVVVEVEHEAPSQPVSSEALSFSRAQWTDSQSDLHSGVSLGEVCDAFCERFRLCTGYERVLVYRFDAQWNGQVLGEARALVLPSLKGHWFPASDIPANVRALYLESPLRVVADILAQQAKLIPEQEGGGRGASDLVGCVSRGVSSLHLEYMRNMGLRASCSIALIVEGSLWGIVSAHHTLPFLPSFAMRKGMLLDSFAFSKELETRCRAKQKQKEQQAKARLERMAQMLKVRGAFHNLNGPQGVSFVESFFHELADLLEIQGLVLWNPHSETTYALGSTPGESAFLHLAQAVRASAPGRIFVTDSLAQWFGTNEFGEQGASQSAGLLRLAFGPQNAWEAYCFRDRVTTHLEWGGNPFEAKSMQAGRIHPRRSFETFRQVVNLQSCAWERETLESAKALLTLLDESLARSEGGA